MDCCESCDCDELSEAIVTLLPSAGTNLYQSTSKRKSITRRTFFILILFACLAPITLMLFNPIYLERDTHLADFENTCQNPPRRQEWRSLGEEEQYNLIKAIQCLAQTPSKLGLPTTRYNDFVHVHVEIYTAAHNVAPFLPWHRYYIYAFERALREECGYKNYLPYWDWTLDASQPEDSPVWSPSTGFGGNGDPDSYHCVTDGPFSNIKLQYPRPHCLWRNFFPGLNGFNYTSEIVSDILKSAGTYDEFRVRLESGPHQSIHNGIGGEMPRDWSPNDPIFFLHHSQIDRLWWTWQQMHPFPRLRDYSGPLSNETNSANGTIHDSMSTLGLTKTITVSEVMNTESRFLCYRY